MAMDAIQGRQGHDQLHTFIADQQVAPLAQHLIGYGAITEIRNG
jgi:hypothetical protein